jgi:hypothetical protein
MPEVRFDLMEGVKRDKYVFDYFKKARRTFLDGSLSSG